VSLPGADELFRATSRDPVPSSASGPGESDSPSSSDVADRQADRESDRESDRQSDSAAAVSPVRVGDGVRSVRRAPRRTTSDRSSSGRERHDEKITVYVSAGELVELEHARLTLRAEHGIAVDRGRIVREALAVVLADLEAKHGESILVRRLGGR
jgi:hypothetical protein